MKNEFPALGLEVNMELLLTEPFNATTKVLLEQLDESRKRLV